MPSSVIGREANGGAKAGMSVPLHRKATSNPRTVKEVIRDAAQLRERYRRSVTGHRTTPKRATVNVPLGDLSETVYYAKISIGTPGRDFDVVLST